MGYTYTNSKLDEITLSGDKRSLHGEKDMSPLVTVSGRKVSWESRCEVPGASRTYVSVFGSTWLAVVGYLVPAWSKEKRMDWRSLFKSASDKH